MAGGNKNPKFKLKSLDSEPIAKEMVGVRLPVELDAYVRSLPNKSEWLRAAVAEKFARDMQDQSA